MKEVIVFLFVTTTMCAQTGVTPKEYYKPPTKWSFGVIASLDINYRTHLDRSDDKSLQPIIDHRDNSDTFLWGYTTGLTTRYNLNNKWSFNTGFKYALRGMQTKESDSTWGMYPEPNGPSSLHIEYRYTYIDLPLSIQYKMGRGKTKLYMNMGIDISFFIQESVWTRFTFEESKDSIRKRTTEYDFSPINVFPTISTGLSVPLNEKFLLDIGPIARYGLINIIDTPLGTRLWNVGIESKLLYTFR